MQNVIDDDMTDDQLNAYPISKDLYKRGGEGDRIDIIDKVDYEDIEIVF